MKTLNTKTLQEINALLQTINIKDHVAYSEFRNVDSNKDFTFKEKHTYLWGKHCNFEYYVLTTELYEKFGIIYENEEYFFKHVLPMKEFHILMAERSKQEWLDHIRSSASITEEA